jgi:hypothetical protein
MGLSPAKSPLPKATMQALKDQPHNQTYRGRKSSRLFSQKTQISVLIMRKVTDLAIRQKVTVRIFGSARIWRNW